MSLLTDRFEKALIYAFNLHKEQTRKSLPIPYFTHLMGVTALVLEAGCDEDTAIAALLHDAVEDHGGLPTLTKIRNLFGDRVGDIVDQCTDAYTIPKPPWRERKEEYISKLHNVSPEARLVSVADKLYNVRTIIDAYKLTGEKVWDRFNGGKEGTIWYYRALRDVYLLASQDLITQTYANTVDEMERLVRNKA
jgi:(p)ppGpp synthase/HD superfamily hydrolase